MYLVYAEFYEMYLKPFFTELNKLERKSFISSMSLKLDRSPVTIRSYINGHRSVQPSQASIVESLTGFKVSKAELCPLVFTNESQSTHGFADKNKKVA